MHFHCFWTAEKDAARREDSKEYRMVKFCWYFDHFSAVLLLTDSDGFTRTRREVIERIESRVFFAKS